MARLRVRSAEIEWQRSRTRLAAQVKRLYLRLLQDRAECAERENLRSWFDRCGQIAQARYAAQNGTFLDILRSRIEVSRADNELAACRLRGRLRQIELNGLLGLPVEAVWRPGDSLDGEPFDQPLEAATAGALSRHGGLRQNELQAAAGRAGRRLARLAALPEFSLAVARQRLNNQPPFDAAGFRGVSGVNGWSLELGLRLPVLAPGQLQAGRLEADARLEATTIRREQLERRVRQAAVSAWERARSADEQVRRCAGALLPDAQAALRTALDEYRLNRISFFELLDTVRAGSESSLALSRARLQLRLALIDLETAGEETAGDEGDENDPTAD